VTSDAQPVPARKSKQPPGSQSSTVSAQLLYASKDASLPLTGQFVAQAACSQPARFSNVAAHAVLHGSRSVRHPPKFGDTMPFESSTAAPQLGALASVKMQLKQPKRALDELDSGQVPPFRQSLQMVWICADVQAFIAALGGGAVGVKPAMLPGPQVPETGAGHAVAPPPLTGETTLQAPVEAEVIVDVGELAAVVLDEADALSLLSEPLLSVPLLSLSLRLLSLSPLDEEDALLAAPSPVSVVPSCLVSAAAPSLPPDEEPPSRPPRPTRASWRLGRASPESRPIVLASGPPVTLTLASPSSEAPVAQATKLDTANRTATRRCPARVIVTL
jgi:hypothetical protein